MPGKVGIVIAASVLSGDNVLNVKRDGVVSLVNSAILAAIVGSRTYSNSCGCIHALPID